MPLKQCSECGGWFEADAFFRSRGLYASSPLRAICIGCEQTKRDAKKSDDGGRWIVKIRDTIRRHAARLKLSVETLEQQYGWNFDRMLHEAKHAYANGCQYCGEPFREMGHGLADLTLDIMDPTRPPYYTTNVAWSCMTCNREKCQKSAAIWGAKRAAWETWKRRRRLPIQRTFWE